MLQVSVTIQAFTFLECESSLSVNLLVNWTEVPKLFGGNCRPLSAARRLFVLPYLGSAVTRSY